MILEYYLLLECRSCDAEIYYGVCASLLEHNGLPVVPADSGTQTRFDCNECGAANYTGDLDVLVEGGVDPDDDDDDALPDDAPKLREAAERERRFERG